jgi:hypothetical protein
MTDEPVPTAFSPTWRAGSRTSPPRIADEPTTLVAFLVWHRTTFELKCAGVRSDQLSERTVPPSTLSLHGVLRHLAGVEGWWFARQFAGQSSLPPGVTPLYTFDDDPDADFDDLDGDVDEAFRVWRAACDRSRAIVAGADSLDALGTPVVGEPFSLRWLMVHMIAEYARHNGQSDLLRERIDGAVGA